MSGTDNFEIKRDELQTNEKISKSEKAIYEWEELPEDINKDVEEGMEVKLENEILRIDTESKDILNKASKSFDQMSDADKKQAIMAIQILLRGQQTFNDNEYAKFNVESWWSDVIIDWNLRTLLTTIWKKEWPEWNSFYQTFKELVWSDIDIKWIIDSLKADADNQKDDLANSMKNLNIWDNPDIKDAHWKIWTDIVKKWEKSEFFIAAKSLWAWLWIDLKPNDLITKWWNENVRKLQELINVEPADWHFWYNTAKKLMDAYNIESEWITITKKENNEWNVNREVKDEIQEIVEQPKDYEPIAEMPRDIKDMIWKYWEWMNDKFYFYWQEWIITDWWRFTWIEWKWSGKDFVWKEWDKTFVEIAWKKYFLWADEWNSVKAKRETTWLYDNDWKPIIREKFQIGTFKDWVMIDWTLLVSEEWKKKSETRLQSLNREHDGVHESLWLKIFNWKARLDFFENWEDTKEMSDEQLDSLTRNDLIKALKLAWQWFSLTEKNPSQYWKYNLNRIIYKATRMWNANKKSDHYDEASVKPVVHKALWLRRWLSSDLDKKVTKLKEWMTTKAEKWLTYREKIQNRLRWLMEKLWATEEDLADLKKHEYNE